jgi:hypothetical protein
MRSLLVWDITAASSGNPLPTFQGNPLVLSSIVKQYKKTFFLDWLALEDGTDRLSRNVGYYLPIYAA